MYRSISFDEYRKLLLGIPIDGKYNPIHISECGNNGYYGNIICAFEDNVKWKDNIHNIFITLEIDENRIIGKGESIWYMPKTFAKTKTYCGKRGNEKWVLNEYYLKQYSILDVVDISFLDMEQNINYKLMYSIVGAINYLSFKSTYLPLKDYSYKEILKQIKALIKLFPDENTLIKKEDYIKSLLRIFEYNFEFKTNEI